MTEETSLRRSRRLEGLSDADLLAATRDGDREAFATLWARHAESAYRVARTVAWTAEADDLVAEAFARILRATTRGGGPVEAFRPYLFTTIRNVATSWGREPRTVTLSAVDEAEVDGALDPAMLVADRTTLARAFAALPERWRTILWYLEVEGMSPREMAPLLGMTPNAVAALAYRAREGFRTAWLEEYGDDDERSEECRWAADELTRPAGRRRGRSTRRRLDAHLEGCPACRVVAASADERSERLRGVLLIAALGGTGAALYSELGGAPAHAVPLAAPTLSSAGGVATAVVAAVVVAGAAGTVLWRDADVDPAPAPATAEQPRPVPRASVATPQPDPGGTPAAPVVEPTTPADETIPEDVAAPRSRPVPTATPSPLPVDRPLPAPSPEDPAPRSMPTPAAVPTPTPVASPTPTPVASPTPPPAPTPSPTPTPTPTAAVVRDVTVDEVDTDATVPSPLAGAGEPGAAVAAVTSGGADAGSATVGDDGRWTIPIDIDALAPGDEVRVVQTSAGHVSSTGAIGPFTLPVPEVTGVAGTTTIPLSDEDGDGAADDVALLLSGIPGETVVVWVDGVATGNRHRLAEEPLTRYIPDLAVGAHTVTVRYLDPVTERTGRQNPVVLDVIAGS